MGKKQKRKKMAYLTDLPPDPNPKPPTDPSARRLQSEKKDLEVPHSPPYSKKMTGPSARRLQSEKKDLEVPQSPPSSKKMQNKDARPLGLDVVVCEKCGDRGFPETLVCCYICQDAFEHRYCFDNASDIFSKDVKWACPDCVDSTTKKINVNLPPRRSVRVSSRNLISEDAVRESNAANTTLPSRSVKSMKRCDMGQNVKQLELPAEVCLNELDVKVCSRPSEEAVTTLNTIMASPTRNGKRKTRCDMGQNVKKMELPDEVCSKKCEGKDCSRPSEEAVTTLNTITTSPTRTVERKTRCDMGQNVKKLELPDEACSKKREGKDCSKPSVETVTSLSSNVVLLNDPQASLAAEDNLSSDGQVHPNMDPVWNGTFSILNDKFTKVDGVVACVLNDANTGVKNEASSLTAFLYPDFLPKSELWSKSFQEVEPSDDSHSIYFFPEKNRDEQVFSSLVNYLTRNDLSMRCEIDDRELLVFTEAALPQKFRRIQDEDFLWGVFSKKASSST